MAAAGPGRAGPGAAGRGGKPHRRDRDPRDGDAGCRGALLRIRDRTGPDDGRGGRGGRDTPLVQRRVPDIHGPAGDRDGGRLSAGALRCAQLARDTA